MHLLGKYGSTHLHVLSEFPEAFLFMNSTSSSDMDKTFAKTVDGLGDYVRENRPDLLVVHGDRVEALAGALVGGLLNIMVAHIEGGETSGTIDESLRHSTSKIAHHHFVANEKAANRLAQMGESDRTIHVIGSPDLDVMDGPLPALEQALAHYGIENFKDFSIVIAHPVTTKPAETQSLASSLRAVLQDTQDFTILLGSNNDSGSSILEDAYSRISNPRVKFFPSLRFEFFLTLLKASSVIIGNSSAGVREAPHFGTPAVNIGSRQSGRAASPMITNCDPEAMAIQEAIFLAKSKERLPDREFGDGRSAIAFLEILSGKEFWLKDPQKKFVDLDVHS